MPDQLRPTAGARFVLELREAHAAGGAAYRAMIYVPDADWRGDAEMRDDGEAVVTGLDGAPPELRDKLAIIAKLVARGASSRRDSGEKLWPARVMRWRGPR
jgi:hypothetical protein|nr:hypothetical protein [Kofleriaceae bacterium]